MSHAGHQDLILVQTSVPQPMLSIVIVRWGGAPSDFNEEQWGALSASTSDRYIEGFLRHVYDCLGPAYEVLSAFIETGSDLSRLQIGSLSSRLRGAHKAACYFLWPTLEQDGSPHREQGMVPAGDVFAAMRQAESAGVPTRFPHPPQLYSLLLSKEWQATQCLSRKYWVPPSTLIPRGAIMRDPRRAAKVALDSLALIRTAPSARASDGDARASVTCRVHACADGTAATHLGVAKLGHAWEAAHVRVFAQTAPQLSTALAELCREVGSEHGCVIVQDYVPNDFELRA